MTTPAPETRKILVASYPTVDGARAGLDRLKSAGTRLGNVALIQRSVEGRIEFTETQDWGLGKSAAVGALAAMLLPGIGIIAGALLGGAASHFIDAGFPDALLRQMGSGIPDGTSLVVALIEEADLTHAERIVTEHGGSIIGSGLEADLERAMGKMR